MKNNNFIDLCKCFFVGVLIFGLVTSIINTKITIAILLFLILSIIVIDWIRHKWFNLEMKYGEGEKSYFTFIGELNNINKMYWNIIPIALLVLLIGGYLFNANILNKDYTHRMNVNLKLCTDYLRENINASIDDIVSDPYLNFRLHQGNHENIAIISALIPSTLENMNNTLSITNSAAHDLVIRDEMISEDKKQELLQQLDIADAEIDSIYGRLQTNAESTVPIDKILESFRQFNSELKEINAEIRDNLNHNTYTNDTSLKIMDLEDSLEDKYNDISQAAEMMKEKISGKISFGDSYLALIMVIMWFSIIRINEICDYYIRLKRYKKKLSSSN